jgi:hypothetical protein
MSAEGEQASTDPLEPGEDLDDEAVVGDDPDDDAAAGAPLEQPQDEQQEEQEQQQQQQLQEEHKKPDDADGPAGGGGGSASDDAEVEESKSGERSSSDDGLDQQQEPQQPPREDQEQPVVALAVSGCDADLDAIELGGEPDKADSHTLVMPEEAVAAKQNKEEKCDPCTRKAICSMTCISPACRMHVISTLLLILSFFLFADQQLVAPNLSQISRDLNLTDAERDLYLGGLVPLCFFAVGTPFTVFMGPIIDRVHRRNLFVLLIFLGEGPCMCTYWVTTVAGLLITRTITGIAMAAAEPLIFSMLSDMCVVFCSWWWLWWLRWRWWHWWCWWWRARELKCAHRGGGGGACGFGWGLGCGGDGCSQI